MVKESLAAKVKRLERQLIEAQCSAEYKLNSAYFELEKLNQSNYLGSAVLISITGLGGAQISTPIYCADGLSVETITALKQQVIYSLKTARRYTGTELLENLAKCEELTLTQLDEIKKKYRKK